MAVMYGQNKEMKGQDNISRVAISEEIDLNAAGTGAHPVINVPLGTYVTGVQIVVTTVIVAGSMDVDIGDGDDVDRFADAWAAATGALALGSIIDCPCGSTTGLGVQSGRYYAAGDTIDVKINTVATSGKIRLLVHCTTLDGVAPASLSSVGIEEVSQ